MAQAHWNFGDMLVEEGILTPDELEEALEKSKTRNLPLEETLFKLGYVSRDRLGNLLAKLYECDFIDLSSCKINDEALRAISAEAALRLRVLPSAVEGTILAVALAGPFMERPLEEIVAELEKMSDRKVRVALCNPESLNEMLREYYGTGTHGAGAGRRAPDELSSMIQSIKSEETSSSLYGQFEELYDLGQTALIGARSHPFSRSVAGAIEEAKAKLVDSRKYAASGFVEEALEMAGQAVSLLKETTAKADSVERAWEKLMQQVRNLRAKIGVFEEDGASEFAPSEFKELSEIRDMLIECVNERNADRLRSLLERGMILTEKVSLVSPDRSRDREQVISSLAQVRQVITRARKMGAKDSAPELLEQAYDFLDQAETYARHAQWDDVRDCLASAESKALEAERIALEAAEEKEQLLVSLREAVGAASAALEEAMIHPFAREVIEDLTRARSVVEEAKACVDSGEYERGIGLAENIAMSIKDEIIARADEAQQTWNELYQRAGDTSALIRSIELLLALKTAPDTMASLSKAQSDLVDSLCERDREKLADAVSTCESLGRDVLDNMATRRDGLRQVEDAIVEAGRQLASAAAAGVDGTVAAAYGEALQLLEEARSLLSRGDVEGALNSAQAVPAKLKGEVIEPQESARAKWRELVPRSRELFERIDSACSPDAMHYCPGPVQALRTHVADMLSALTARDPERIEAGIAPLEQAIEAIATAISHARLERYKDISEQLARIEESVQGAVQRCAGNYAPDMLEDAYFDLNQIKSQIAGGPEALTAPLEHSLRRDLAVAQAKVWQVDYLRDRFEREREESLNHLRMKMDSARQAIDGCVTFDFVGEDSPLVQKARESLEQADSALVEGDINESFELVRQSEALAEEIRVKADEKERQWKELAERLTEEAAPHRTFMSDRVTERAAESEYRELCELSAQTQLIIDTKSMDALEEHAEKLRRLCDTIRERVETTGKESRSRIERKIQEAGQEIRLAQLLKAEGSCPDVINAARAYMDIAGVYLERGDFARADSAARDAIAKSRDAGILAQASLERAGTLALDYMRIAAARLDQQQIKTAKEAIQQGLSLAELARASRKDACGNAT